MELNNISIKESIKTKDQERKINIELYATSEPLFRASEVIAVYTKSKDRRTYSNLTIIVEPTTFKLTTYSTLTKGLIKALDSGEFRDMGDSKSLFYATLEPIASLINSSEGN